MKLASTGFQSSGDGSGCCKSWFAVCGVTIESRARLKVTMIRLRDADKDYCQANAVMENSNDDNGEVQQNLGRWKQDCQTPDGLEMQILTFQALDQLNQEFSGNFESKEERKYDQLYIYIYNYKRS